MTNQWEAIGKLYDPPERQKTAENGKANPPKPAPKPPKPKPPKKGKGK